MGPSITGQAVPGPTSEFPTSGCGVRGGEWRTEVGPSITGQAVPGPTGEVPTSGCGVSGGEWRTEVGPSITGQAVPVPTGEVPTSGCGVSGGEWRTEVGPSITGQAVPGPTGEVPTSGPSPQLSCALQCTQYSHPVSPAPQEDIEIYRSVKRTTRTSPISSPNSLTRSPYPKRYKRSRTFSKAHKLYGFENPTSHSSSFQRTGPQPVRSDVSFEGFKVSSSEARCLEETQKLIFTYMYQKELIVSDKLLMDLKSYYGAHEGAGAVPDEQSNVVFLSIIDKCADTHEAMEEVLSKLHKELDIGVTATHLVLVGDQKTYNRLWELKHMYGTDLNWLIPFIGDWHLLSNFQSVLMKVYFDAGLKDVAHSSGFRAETLTSLAKCSNFKRTNQFILQAWEALYRHMLSCFLSSSVAKHHMSSEHVKECLEDCDNRCSRSASHKPLAEHIAMLA